MTQGDRLSCKKKKKNKTDHSRVQFSSYDAELRLQHNSIVDNAKSRPLHFNARLPASEDERNSKGMPRIAGA